MKQCLAVFRLDRYSGLRHFAGVLRHFSESGDLLLAGCKSGTDFTERDVRTGADGGYDGFLVSVPGSAAAMAALVRSETPTVLVNIDNLALSARDRNISFVWLDNEDIGRRAAEHLLLQGVYKSYGFMARNMDEFFFRERESAFRRTLAKQGFKSSVFPGNGEAATPDEILGWLAPLPRPVGIMAANARIARHLTDVLQLAGLPVPSQVSVIAVDNDPLLNPKDGLGISSVLPDFESIGYAAAAELSRIVRSRGRARPREIVIPAQGIAVRESTRPAVAASRLVANALRFIEAHPDRNLRPGDVAAEMGCSQRLLDLRFAELRGETVRTAVERIRMQRAAKCLRDGDNAVTDVARALRFTSSNQLSRIFRRHFGKSIREFQREQ